MRLVHIADLHIGKIVNGFPMIDDQRHALSRLVEDAVGARVDALLIAGDIYDKSNPSAEAVALFDWFLGEVLDAGLTCLAVPGNHDSAERVAYAAGPLARQGIHVAPLFDGALRRVTLDDEHGPVDFWLCPFLKPAQVRPYFLDAEIGTDYTAALEAVLDACGIDRARRNVLLCHQFVTWSGAEPQRSDSELSVGGLDNVDASVFDAFDYVALGHIHRPQRIGRDEVRYAGSLLKYSASEADHAKTATLVDLGPKSPDGTCRISLDSIPLIPLHDMRRIKGPLAELLKPEVAGAGNAQDYLHVTLTDPALVIDALARLRSVYPNVMSLEYRRGSQAESAAEATRAGRSGDEDPEILFARFFEEQTGAPLSKRQKELAETLLESAREGVGGRAEGIGAREEAESLGKEHAR